MTYLGSGTLGLVVLFILLDIILHQAQHERLTSSFELVRCARLEEPVESACQISITRGRNAGNKAGGRTSEPSDGTMSPPSRSPVHSHSDVKEEKIDIPEQRPFTDIPLDQLVTIIPINPMVVHPHQQEPILLIRVALAFRLTICQLQLLHRERVRLDLAMQSVNTVGLFAQLSLAGRYAFHQPVGIFNVS